jgi:aromatic amino acid aminotransferase I
MAPPSAISYDIESVTDTEALVLPDPLTVNGVTSRRAKAGKLVAGTAAYTSSDFFKSSVRIYIIRKVNSSNIIQTAGKPKAKRWDRKSSNHPLLHPTNLIRLHQR